MNSAYIKLVDAILHAIGMEGTGAEKEGRTSNSFPINVFEREERITSQRISCIMLKLLKLQQKKN